MTHIAFITLFLGLVTGVQPIQMKVNGPAAKIEFVVDGQVAGTITQPWSAVINLGSHLRPHHVVARALDDSGREVARVEQVINLPESLSALDLVLERDGHARPAGVQLLWHSLEADRPKSVSLLLDAKPLTLDDHLHAAIPAIDLQRPHVLRGRAIAPSGTPSSTELAFGGGIEDQAGAHLTAIAVRLRRPDATIEQSLRIGDEPAKIVAVEQVPGEIVVVRHPLPIETAMKLDPMRGSHVLLAGVSPRDDLPTAMFVWPVSQVSEANRHPMLFEWSPAVPFSGAEGLRFLLTRSTGPSFSTVQFAQAVAVAGLRATSGRRPRAVVFILGERGRDDSAVTTAQAREYLRSIGVPLYVWSLGVSDTGGWGEATDISSPAGYRKAFETLQKDLQSQRVVWIEGDHLPADVTSANPDVEVLAKP